MMRKTVLCLILMAMVCVAGAWADGAVEDAVVLATNSAHISKDVVVLGGDVIVNDSSDLLTLADGVELSFDRGSTVADAAKADSIKADNNVSIGTVECNALDSSGVICTGLGLPVFSALPPFEEAVVRPEAPLPHDPGQGEDVSVGVDQTETLAAGDYGDITIDKGGTLVLAGGVYNVASIGFASSVGGQCPFPCRSLEFQAPTELRIFGTFDSGKATFIGPGDGSTADASSIVLYVGGTNLDPADPNSSPQAAKVGEGSTVEANFYVPRGTFLLTKNSTATGAFLGRDVEIDKDATVDLASAFGNEPPVGDPQTVFTNGLAAITITLTGSDPEEGDLTFSIEENPTEGSLSVITHIVPDPVPEIDPETGQPTGNFLQPPISSANVTYTPEFAGEDVEDAFTFKVTDPANLMGTAVVDINPFDTSPPAPPLTQVEAEDVEVDAVLNTTVEIVLDAGAPESVALTYSLLSLPDEGPLVDSEGTTIETVPFDLPSRSVFFTPTSGFTGGDSFVFAARDSLTSGSCVSPSCDSATVTIDIAEPFELANDQTVETNLNEPVQVTLNANSGGVQGGNLVVTSSGSLMLPGSTIAGNVSDADGDGFGDGRDSLPGPAPVLIAAGVDINLGSTPSGSVSDPSGDATNSTSDDPANPDLVSASVSSDGTNLNLEVRFVAAGFDPNTSRGSFVLDIDENPATGFPGIDAANNDSALMGIEFLINIGGVLGASADVLKFSSGNSFPNVGTFSATVLADGYTVSIPLSTLNNDDGRLTFKVETQSGLPPGTGHTGILDYMPDLGLAPGEAKTGVQGVARVQIEWDVTSLANTDLEDIEAATVTLTTEKGTVDDMDTMFFVGTQNQDGFLEVSDFEASADVLDGAVMPVPAGSQTGDEGTFSFSVTSKLKEALGQGFVFFSIQGRVDEAEAGSGFRRGLQIHSTATGNLTLGKEPQLDVVVSPAAGLSLQFEILSLPSAGSLTDLSGTPVSVGQTFFTERTTLVYTPPVDQSGTFSFEYQATEGAVVDTAIIEIIVSASDSCILVGRNVGCAPSG